MSSINQTNKETINSQYSTYTSVVSRIYYPPGKPLGILNGTEELPPEVGSLELCNDIALSKRVVKYVQNTIPFSPNYLRTGACFPKAKKERLIDFLSEKKLQIEEKKTAKEVVDAAKRLRVGSCVEMSFIGFQYAKENQIPVELLSIANGNHVFLRIGTVISDTWAGTTFPEEKKEQFLVDFKGFQKGYTIVAPYDSSLQSICNRTEEVIEGLS